MARKLSNFEIYLYSVFRGHQERQLIKKQSEMAIKIQRRFRRHLSEASNTEENNHKESKENKENDEEKSKQELLELRRENRENRVRGWREDTPELLRKEYKAEIGEQTKEEFNLFQDEITELKWKSEQQIERNVYLDGSSPRKILFISSNIQKSSLLAEARLADVITFDYDFAKDTFENLINMLETNLEEYRAGSRARSICFVCQGGPGHLYILKKRVLTSPKLKKESEADQVRFWKSIGKCMSKIRHHESVIHIMGCNILGNSKGQQLFDELEAIMRPSIVKIKAPLELSEEGQDMISAYFDKPKYNTWKMRRYSKTE
ncbi:NMDA receptor synaptonuclear signaling and neuronal migration factor [Holothuria leucospilota]|uniref:NMDA receptor synaptonuclear signaling and neuronal migration factor n=1 Tax=Holothuria leucospilota TaxID=206669 RepID=A0A9Q1C5H2_HOLLE|nr:NMDA receptor synaptonuclear signaling and neuronal migration factor [Holothuria leucospilota]